MNNVKTAEEGNRLIETYLEGNEPFYVGRIGITEMQTMYHFLGNRDIPNSMKMDLHHTGFYGDCFPEFCAEYMESLRTANIHVYWEHLDGASQQNLFQTNAKNAILVKNRSVEPFCFENPWSYALRGKRILVVHPFVESISHQYKNRENLWKNDRILPKFELITYKSVQSLFNNETQSYPHTSWIESLNAMKNDISDLDFDVALLGCGSYGMPLSSFIKTDLKKSSIYIGGGLQLLFGIKGSRWDGHEYSKYYNNYWSRPLVRETPDSYKNMENGAYW